MLGAIFLYSGHHHETPYSKISMTNDGRYLFTGCVSRTGVMWLTDLPYNEKPIYEIINNSDDLIHELSISDWCADPTCMKVSSKLYFILPLLNLNK